MELLPNLEIEPALDDMRSDEELTQEAVDSVEDAERPISPFVRPPRNKEVEALAEPETLAEPTFSANRRKKVVSDKQRAHLDRIRVLAHEKRRSKAAEKKAAREREKTAKREASREEKLQRRREKYAADKAAKQPPPSDTSDPEQQQHQQQHAAAVLQDRTEEMRRGAKEHAAKDFQRFMSHMEAFQKLQHEHHVTAAKEKVKAAAKETQPAPPAPPAPKQPKQSNPVKLVDPAPYNAYDSWFG